MRLNSKFRGELSNNKYSNIIGVQTSVYNPSGRVAPSVPPAPSMPGKSMAPPMPMPPTPTPPEEHKEHGGYYGGGYGYPYLYPYPVPVADVVPVVVEERNDGGQKSVTPVAPVKTTAVATEMSFIGKTSIVILAAALLYGGYRIIKSKN